MKDPSSPFAVIRMRYSTWCMAGFQSGTTIGAYSGGLIGFMTAAAAPGAFGYGLYKLVRWPR
jgi:hypothetical protein